MPLRETEAIVLRTYRLGEADKIVSLFTRQMGRLRAVASGAQRTKTRYGGTLESLTYIRLWVFERENRDLLRVNSTELLESFFDMQKDYRTQVAAQYLVEVTERMLPEREVNERAFRLLVTVSRAMKQSGEIDRPLVYFNYWMLRLGGFLPSLDRCCLCGRELGGEPGYYGAGSEGLMCADCRSGAPQALSAEARTLAANARGQPVDQWMGQRMEASGVGAAAEARHVRRFLEELIEVHVEKKLVTRELLAEDF